MSETESERYIERKTGKEKDIQRLRQEIQSKKCFREK